MKRGDVQERVVQLYFVRDWQLDAICDRYRLGKSTVRKLLSDWKIRAVAAGYIQAIHPDALPFLDSERRIHWHKQNAGQSDPDSARVAEAPAWENVLPPPEADRFISATSR